MVLEFNSATKKTVEMVKQIKGDKYKGYEVIFNEMTNYQAPFEIDTNSENNN